jgi:[acyl-carrier-protein] S-malonyltransferase
MSIAFLFPGQGSQKSGMGAGLEGVGNAFATISEAIGRDVAAICNLQDEELRRTQNAQVALYACGVAAAKSLGLEPAFAAGHSVGEYAALAVAGVVSVADGARLVARRGELMAGAGGGTMAAVLGLDDATIEKICAETPGTVVVANYNCPGQAVISGDTAAVEEACQACLDAGARLANMLNVSGAFHSPLVQSAGEGLRAMLAETPFNASAIRLPSNVTGAFVDDPSDWPELLARQAYSPVRWTSCVRAMLDEGATEFHECGPGNVLMGLMKRIAPES